MRITTRSNDLSDIRADVAVAFAAEGDREPRGIDDPDLRAALARRMKAETFRGRPGDVVSWMPDGDHRASSYHVIGLGAPGGPAGAAIRRAAARAARLAVGRRATSLALRVPPSDDPERADAEIRAAVEGAIHGAYRFDRYVTDPDRRTEPIGRLTIATERPASAARRAARRGEVAGKACDLARDLVNEPPSTLDPTEMTRRIRALARASGLRVKVLGRRDLERMGFGALLAVARGAGSEPRVVHLTYVPDGGRAARRARHVLVGKGVTFDSGGLNLKPTPSMADMKCDMAGAAAVVATMSGLKDAGCRAEVHGLVGLVENMTGAKAYKPGDILRTRLGKTVEVTNTDAEGRLVLADVLSYAVETLKPRSIVDVATLTGACVVALGTGAAGLFPRDPALGAALSEAAGAAGERVWAMPMWDDYLESMQGGPADLRNTGERWGGAITAALFLGEFVDRSVPWAHLDIAGPAFREKAGPEAAAGGTGAAVRTLLRWAEGLGGR